MVFITLTAGALGADPDGQGLLRVVEGPRRLHSLARGPCGRAGGRLADPPGMNHEQRGRDVSLGSLLAGSEPTLRTGTEAVVGVAVATLWASPDRVRPVDDHAIWVPSRPRDWIESMSPEDRADLAGRTLASYFWASGCIVEEIRDDWARVVALSQPTRRDPRGYPGWLPIDQLSTLDGIHAAGVRVAARHRENEEVSDLTGVWHVVVATATALRDDPDAALAVPGVTFGTRLMALGAPHDGWLPVAVPGRFEPAWAIEEDVAAVQPSPPSDNAEVLEWADRLRDVTYLPGGMSAYGVDGPGFVHLVWRRFSVMLPRDARRPGRRDRADPARPRAARRPLRLRPARSRDRPHRLRRGGPRTASAARCCTPPPSRAGWCWRRSPATWPRRSSAVRRIGF